jgi:hypothetical protein
MGGRSPDAAQRAALAAWCAADPGSIRRGSLGPGSAERREEALHRVRDTMDRHFPTHFGGRFSENAFGPSI